MISLIVDEAYAFDYLSILAIKKDFSEQNLRLWFECEQNLKRQFSESDWLRIIESKEYKAIVDANKKTFDAVDKAKTNDVTAQYVDYCNYERYLAKKQLQETFFSKSISEFKIGYDKLLNSESNINS